MRFAKLIWGDICFQFRYGFYALYALLSAVYLLILYLIPDSIRQTMSTIIIFSDPAAMGIFFMGAIILLEKSQRVNASLAVSPVKIWEYIFAKAISLAIIGTAAATVITIFYNTENIPLTIAGIFCSSILFSLYGLFAAMKIDSLNKFILTAVPASIFIMIPGILYVFGVFHAPWAFLHPGIAAVKLLSGNTRQLFPCMASLLIWSYAAYVFCHKAVKKSFSEMGGGKI